MLSASELTPPPILMRRGLFPLGGVAQRSDELLEIFTVDLDEIAEFTAT